MYEKELISYLMTELLAVDSERYNVDRRRKQLSTAVSKAEEIL